MITLSSGDEDEDVEETDHAHVKTVSEMAEEANTSDLFDPRVLGKLQPCAQSGSPWPRCQTLPSSTVKPGSEARLSPLHAQTCKRGFSVV